MAAGCRANKIRHLRGLADSDLVPCQATFACLTTSCSIRSANVGREVLAGKGGAGGDQIGGGSLEDDPATVVAGNWWKFR